jgi:hypothetical protein
VAAYRCGVAPTDPASAREFLEAIIAAFSILGGVMAYFSGYAAYRSLSEPTLTNVADDVNQGLGEGFALGVPSAILALMIMGWS